VVARQRRAILSFGRSEDYEEALLQPASGYVWLMPRKADWAGGAMDSPGVSGVAL
jgi:hypothetical protein